MAPRVPVIAYPKFRGNALGEVPARNGVRSVSARRFLMERGVQAKRETFFRR